jgi:hypothetical protein
MASLAKQRPGKGFTSARAEKWVLASALITGVVYVVRHLVEGESSAPPATSAARAFLGQGSPPSVGQWLIAYATGFLFLSIMAALAPELAASAAMFVVFTTFIESGGQLASDLKQLESGTAGSGPAAPTGTINSPGFGASAVTQTSPLILNPTFAPSPQSIGATVANNSSQLAAINKALLAQAPDLPPGYTVKIVNGVGELLHNGKVVQTG